MQHAPTPAAHRDPAPPAHTPSPSATPPIAGAPTAGKPFAGAPNGRSTPSEAPIPRPSAPRKRRRRPSHAQPHVAPPNDNDNNTKDHDGVAAPAYAPDDDSEAAREHRRNIMDMELRRALLEADAWALAVEPKRICCRGCARWIKLDARSMYYRGLWDKHRDLCRAIKRLRGEPVPKVCCCCCRRRGKRLC